MILVLEDDPLQCKLLVALLARARYTVLTAQTMREAFVVLADRAVDLVIADLELPDGNGLDVVRQLRATPHTAGLPIVICTMHVVREYIEEARESGVVAYLRKPLDPRTFPERIRNVVDALPPRWEPRGAVSGRLAAAGIARQDALTSAVDQLDQLSGALVDTALHRDGASTVPALRDSALGALKLAGATALVRTLVGQLAPDGSPIAIESFRAAVRLARAECVEELWRVHRIRVSEAWA